MRVQARIVATWETSHRQPQPGSSPTQPTRVVQRRRRFIQSPGRGVLTTSHCVESRLIYNLGDPVISPVVYVYAVYARRQSLNVRENGLGFDSCVGSSLFGQCLCWPSRPLQPVAHCPRTLHWKAMQPCRIVIRPALPQKSKLFRHPDSLLAWAVHPLDGKACLRTQSTLPATAAHLHCIQLCHSRGWKNTGTKPKH